MTPRKGNYTVDDRRRNEVKEVLQITIVSISQYFLPVLSDMIGTYVRVIVIMKVKKSSFHLRQRGK